jgi:hypothetical protein
MGNACRLRGKISEGIEGSDWMVVVLSPNSLSSPWVRDELNAGLAKSLELKSVFVLPLFLSGEDETLPVFLKDKLYADFRYNYTEGFRRLLASIIGKELHDIKFVSKVGSKGLHEVLNSITSYIKFALSDFVNNIEDEYGTSFISYTCNTTGYYEAEVEMGSMADAYDSLVLYGLVTSAISLWNLERRPKVYRLAGKLTHLGYLVAKELGLTGIKHIKSRYLPER